MGELAVVEQRRHAGLSERLHRWERHSESQIAAFGGGSSAHGERETQVSLCSRTNVRGILKWWVQIGGHARRTIILRRTHHAMQLDEAAGRWRGVRVEGDG